MQIITDMEENIRKAESNLELLLRLSIILTYPNIKEYIDEIHEIRLALEDRIDDEQKIEITSRIKNKVQEEASRALDEAGGSGAIYIATAVGKTKIGIGECVKLVIKSKVRTVDGVPTLNPTATPNILIVVPTEKLRDEGWHEEFKKWKAESVYNNITRECYASLHSIEGRIWDLVILDEAHNLTEANSVFFENNSITRLVALTATKPTDKVKLDIFEKLGIEPVYTLTLDQAVKLGITAPYDVTIVTVKLDNKNRYVKAGNKQGYFFKTEAAQYEYLSRVITEAPSKMAYLKRMRLVYSLRSKMEATKWILDNVIPSDKRTLIFCGTKERADELCEYHYYSKPTKPKVKENIEHIEKYERQIANYHGDDDLNAFKEMRINRLSCVAALNEGHNIENLDYGIMNQVDSEERRLVQRLGRILRFRPGHRGKIIIMCAHETVDKDWVTMATKGLSLINVRWVDFEKLKKGEETLFKGSESSS